jgi:hypothetical protein
VFNHNFVKTGMDEENAKANTDLTIATGHLQAALLMLSLQSLSANSHVRRHTRSERFSRIVSIARKSLLFNAKNDQLCSNLLSAQFDWPSFAAQETMVRFVSILLYSSLT